MKEIDESHLLNEVSELFGALLYLDRHKIDVDEILSIMALIQFLVIEFIKQINSKF